MGTYTGLRMKIKLNDYGMEVVQAYYLAELVCAAHYKICGWDKDVWNWKLLAPQFPEIHAFINAGLAAYKPDSDGHSRAQCIPGGPLACVWGWEEDTYKDEEWGRYHGKLEGRVWTFQAGLKNYWSDINHFLEIVVPAIAEEVLYGTVHYDNCGLNWDYPEEGVVDWRVVAKNHPEHDRMSRARDLEEKLRRERQDSWYGL